MPKTTPRTAAQAHIDRLVKRIVAKFHPERVILFGSHARGEAGPDSDIDLLVVMAVEGSAYEKGLEVSLALPDLPVPVDVIVTTPEDFAWRKDVVGTIEWPAAREGKVLHARPSPWYRGTEGRCAPKAKGAGHADRDHRGRPGPPQRADRTPRPGGGSSHHAGRPGRGEAGQQQAAAQAAPAGELPGPVDDRQR
jgi:predicted nucleotidyltransferase